MTLVQNFAKKVFLKCHPFPHIEIYGKETLICGNRVIYYDENVYLYIEVA